MSRAAVRSVPVIGIVGWKKSGKTTLVVGLIEEFTRHNFQVDDKDTDSARHRRAGAAQVAVVSARRWALIGELGDEPEPDLAEVIGWLGPCDLVIVEGYKSAAIPKIEARRHAAMSQETLADGDPNVKAIAADHRAEGHGLPVFSLDDVAGIADFIAGAIGLRPAARDTSVGG
jgi:molybdopterin-guanine dinucleotide biosynthesis adapter protein